MASGSSPGSSGLPAAVGAVVGFITGGICVVGALLIDASYRGISPLDLQLLYGGNTLHILFWCLPPFFAWVGWAQLRVFELLGEVRRVTLRAADEEPTAPRNPVSTEDAAWSGDAVADGLLDGILLVRKDGEIEKANTAAEKIFGYAKADFAALKIAQLLPDLEAAEGDSVHRRTSTDSVLGVEWTMRGRHKSGNNFPISLSYSPIDESRFLYIVTDETERLKAEQERERELRAKRPSIAEPAAEGEEDVVVSGAQLLMDLSHELRTPLNAIIGYGELIASDGDHELNSGDSLTKLSSAARHLMELFNNIVDMTKLDTGRMTVGLEPVALAPLLSEVEATTKLLAEEHHNHVHLEHDRRCASVKADPMRLRQILLNLTANACKFTENGDVTLKVGFEQRGADTWVAFQVVDTGMGMTSEQRDHLFDEYTGSGGLGLLLSKKLAELMNGELDVESQKGEGSTFTLRLPSPVIGRASLTSATFDPAAFKDGESKKSPRRTIVPELIMVTPETAVDTQVLATNTAIPLDEPLGDDPVEPIPPAQASRSRRRRRRRGLLSKAPEASKSLGPVTPSDSQRVLLVDDDPPALRELVVRHLEDASYQVTVATSAEQAAQLAKDLVPLRAIVLEVTIDDGAGWQLLETLKAEEQTAAIPVIVASISASEERALEAGASAAFAKPVDRDQLTAAVHKAALGEQPVLVVHSDEDVRGRLIEALEAEGWPVDSTHSGLDALDRMSKQRPAMIVVDPQVPDLGFEFFTALRSNRKWRTLPIVAVGVPEEAEDTERLRPLVQAFITDGDTDQVGGLLCQAAATLVGAR